MRYPEFLKDNGTIGFVAPSFGCATEPYMSAFNEALEQFEKLGYKTNLGPNCRESSGIGISNTPELCGKELNDAMTNVDNDVIISCGGGELMCEVVPHIDFNKIAKSKPKWYMGYSDNTNYTFLSNILSDTAAIYGPCAASFGMKPWDKSLYDALDVLRGKRTEVTGYEKWELEGTKDEEHPYEAYNLTEDEEYVYYPSDLKNKGVELSGRLLGGCVDCLVNLTGTDFDKVKEFNKKYENDGIIWFLECCDLNVFSIRRSFWNMRNAGWFDNAKGFLIGRPRLFHQDFMGLDQYRAVTDIIGDLNVPVIMDLDIGHLPPMMPIISGSYANVTAVNNEIKIKYDFK
ncbi:MAG: LD-carboxypeptidase [Butyrivibrio sp.]|nr:LD-carboxypeptidase [Butyrivibrio sp.]